MSAVTKRDRRAANGSGYETYVCVKRLHHGPSRCSQRPIRRDAIDEAVYRYFEQVALDEDATRRAVEDHAARAMADADASLRQAEDELARVESALARIEGDYIEGKISAEKWDRLEARLRGEMSAARAQAEQHARRRQEVQDAIAALDVEKEVAQELTALRRAIAGQVKDGSHGGLDSFRATLRRLFVGFELASPSAFYGSGALRAEGQPWAQSERLDENLLGAGDYWLIPVIQPHAVDLEGTDDAGCPSVQRAALALHSNLCARLAAW